MSKEVSSGQHQSAKVEGFDALAELALNLRWSWTHATDEVWRRLDPELCETTHSPWVVLQTASRDKIEHAMADPAFCKMVDGLVQTRRKAIESPAWFQQDHPVDSLASVAYFSMEFILSKALPIYSGCLGNVAGDQLKAASDLGVPPARPASDYTIRAVPKYSDVAVPLESSRILWQR
jgi:starch phosphorylase